MRKLTAGFVLHHRFFKVVSLGISGLPGRDQSYSFSLHVIQSGVH